jgi:hypothetical protein
MSVLPRLASATAWIGIATVFVLLTSAPLHATECPSGSPALRGQILDAATQVPLVGADVLLTYRREGDRRERTYTVRTGAGGLFQACDVPVGASLRVQAKYSIEQSDIEYLTFDPAQPLRLAMATPHSVLMGRVVVAGSNQVVPNASVRLAGTPLQLMTGTDGRFRFPRVPPGDYKLDVEHIGYRLFVDSVSVDFMATVDVTVGMSVDAVALAPLQVSTRSFYLDRVGFYGRRERLAGSFLTRAEFMDRRPSMASDLLRSMAGIRLQPRRGNIGLMPIGRGNCGFRYILDGTRIGPGFEIDDIRPDWIEAIEIYRGASEVPGEFTGPITDPRANCGVIVVWTRVR